jgi:hypothetical protein
VVRRVLSKHYKPRISGTDGPSWLAFLAQAADIVERDRVIAGTDCGFGTFAGFGPVEPDIVYLKLRSLVQGARIASKRLWRARSQLSAMIAREVTGSAAAFVRRLLCDGPAR